MTPSKASKIARFVWESNYGEIPEGLEIDHIDCNIENNLLENLRLCSHAENTRNRRKWTQKRSLKKSKYKGVYWCNKRNKWIAQIRHEGVTKYIGQFGCEASAHDSWCAVAKILNAAFFRKE